jgi:hypothetical protein
MHAAVGKADRCGYLDVPCLNIEAAAAVKQAHPLKAEGEKERLLKTDAKTLNHSILASSGEKITHFAAAVT